MTENTKETEANLVEQLFEDVNKTNPQEILVVSLDSNGNMNFNTNVNNYRAIQYILSRALFEVNVHEKSSRIEAEAKASEEVTVGAV